MNDPNIAAVGGETKAAAEALVAMQASPVTTRQDSGTMSNEDKVNAAKGVAADITTRVMQSPSGQDTVHYTNERKINLDPFKDIDLEKTSIDNIDLHFMDEDDDAVPLSLKETIFKAVQYACVEANLQPTRAFVARNQDEKELLSP